MYRKGSDIQSLLSNEIVLVSTVGVYVVDGDVQKRVRYTEFVIQRDNLGINSRSVCGGWVSGVAEPFSTWGKTIGPQCQIIFTVIQIRIVLSKKIITVIQILKFL